jgi:hypothetical protein
LDPVHAKTLTNAQAGNLIDKLRHFHPLNSDEVIDTLKLSFIAYKTYASRVTRKKVDVLQWHYDLYEHLEADEMVDTCRYCKSNFSPSACKCAERLRTWWEVASLVVLVQPSSAAAERVFSLLKNFWSVQQTHSLSDAIRASLYLAYNKREL